MYILVRIWEWMHLTEPWLHWQKQVRGSSHVKWIKAEGPPRLVWGLHNAIKDPGSFYFLLCHLQNVAFFIVLTGGCCSASFASVFQEGGRGRMKDIPAESLRFYQENYFFLKHYPVYLCVHLLARMILYGHCMASREPGNRNDFNWAYCCSNKIRVLLVRKKGRLAIG